MADAAQVQLTAAQLVFWDLVMKDIVTGISLRWILRQLRRSAWLTGHLASGWSPGVHFYLPLALCWQWAFLLRYPQEGGMYGGPERAFGEFPGFMLTGWT